MSIVCKKEERDDKITYPCLMKSKMGNIVLFDREGTGICIYSNSSNTFGKYLINGWDMNTFEKFKGKVIIENT